MKYTALYRKWRSQRFNEVVGQEHIVKALTNAISMGWISHAYLFSGPRGTGKTTVARIFAKSLNCVNGPTIEPCNKCEQCISIQQGTSLDVIELDAASNRGIDEIRNLREQIRFVPMGGKYRVFIIDEAHMLTQEAFNALLKTLEEPPSNIIFILATTDPQKIPPTIASRCLRFDFRRIPNNLIKKRLKEIAEGENVPYDDGSLDILSKYADGSLRDALAYMEESILYGGGRLKEKEVIECLGIPSELQVRDFLIAIYKGDINKTLEILDEIIGRGVEIKVFVDNVLSSLKEMAFSSEKRSGINWSIDDIVKCISIFEDVSSKLRWYSFPRLVLEVGVAKIINILKHPIVVSEPEKSEIPSIEFSVDLERIKDLWPLFLDAVKKESIRLHAVLRECSPRSFSDDTLTVSVKAGLSFHHEYLNRIENKRILERILHSVLKRNVKIDFIMEDGKEDKIKSAVNKVAEIFNGSVIATKKEEKKDEDGV
ncbi:MAG: DNA polymerase III subunit gamma/tau [bacterium]